MVMASNHQGVDDLSASLIQFLETHNAVKDVVVQKQGPATLQSFLSWEAANYPFRLPEDLKAFLHLHDGFDLSWSLNFRGTSRPLGRCHLNSLEDIKRIPVASLGSEEAMTDDDSDLDEEEEEKGSWGLKRDVGEERGTQRGRAVSRRQSASQTGAMPGSGFSQSAWLKSVDAVFDLDNSCGCGQVFLVFWKQDDDAEGEGGDGGKVRERETGSGGTSVVDHVAPAQIFFKDLSGETSFIADSFSDYFRLMISHMGVPRWQLAFTSAGLDFLARQCFSIFCPERLRIDAENCRRRQNAAIAQNVPTAGVGQLPFLSSNHANTLSQATT
uniref:Knr4/Smi1-like domain-containing protein n=1 Tax=Chromera velia CCMP2878 TaxID=1169474 RepID=A0A0G4G641_9ALVE|mmetsp:Transcript_24512/g.48058  ORF Transcript_24512/g.48058 Transcript_24512/m.48058 type:complete len:328 (-) Transcript_24512:284-1267(-)|eukprot:Cvel_20457.t1-p1 / transcript=Cvel_20457.t1 / gene=Cvel_20457 / organism=Chromera_velia_CCMP2878 / gene_product=Tubulin polyglutamylase complex subunit 2, putative / transcript_product=Tubulin polyglutamylase complex subunit 2, putative / location=Cvel_scaffold1836:5229-6209(+) / protein_length=327 / sequence_SO=supercontig / SO=protein_coding / is_pseudo=false